MSYTCPDTIDASEVPEHLKNMVIVRHPLSDEQKQIYEQFKLSLGSDIYVNKWESEEVWLTRFLIARQWNVENAKTMYLETREWRAQIFPQRVSAENILRQIKFKTFEFTRVKDKYGRPLVVTTGRRANPNLNDNVQAVEEGFIWGMELLAKMCRPPTNHFIHVMDLQDWSPIKNFSRKFTQATSKISQSYYPDYMGATFIINYPWAVWGAYKIAEMLMDPHTLEKVHFLKKEDSDRIMRELFNIDELPVRLGGTKVESVPPSSELDKHEVEQWHKMIKLPEPERTAAFEAALNDYLAQCTAEEAAFWRAMRDSEADPYNFTSTDDAATATTTSTSTSS